MRKVTIVFLSILAIGIGVCIGGRFIIFWQIERALLAKVEKLRDSGVAVEYKSIHVNRWTGNVDLLEIAAQWQGQDSECRSRAFAPHILVRGIHLIPLLFDHKLVVDSAVAANPQITLAKGRPPKDEETVKADFLSAIEIQLLRIDSGTLTLINNQCETKLSADLGLLLNQVTIKGLDHDSTLWSVAAAETNRVTIALPTEFYEYTLQKISYSRADQLIRVDTIRMRPTLGNLEFAQKSGRQIDIIHCTIPGIDMHGVIVGESLPADLTIEKVDMAFMISVYRDKRFPHAPRKRPSRLPLEIMRLIPLSLRIDSLNLHNSTIVYEEVPETGGVPGTIGFHALHGSIANITTDSVGETVMAVRTRFMNAGDLDARFTFPMTPGKSNTAQATLSNFSMVSINTMLLPIANLEVQSGTLQKLSLQFQYNEYKSTGELDLRYTDLHVKSIRKNKERSTNKVVTLLINTMVQNNMDRSDDKSKRSGAIDWKRDPQSGLLNYWWKSVLSGIRSVYRLENVLSI